MIYIFFDIALSALLRRIDLVTNLLSPIVTGLLITYGSPTLGAIVISVWNIVTTIVVYALLHMIYNKVPALAIKEVDPTGRCKILLFKTII